MPPTAVSVTTPSATASSDTAQDAINPDDAVTRGSESAIGSGILVAVVYFWVRMALIVSVSPFETPDTESYRSGQATRPPISAFLLSTLGDRPFVVVSALVSSAGFAALVWALWSPQHRRLSLVLAATVVGVSFLPLVTVYEHWLVPDSLLIGLALLALSLAWKPIDQRWYPWILGSLCLLITLTKEVGFGVVLLVGAIAMLRRSVRLGLVVIAMCAVVFAFVVLPASGSTGRVLWHQPADTQLTMERFRIVVGGLIWTDLSPELTEVGQLSAGCGMTMDQLVAETFLLTDQIVSFRNCSELWEATDRLSQVDVLVAHAENPKYVGPSIERAFVPNLRAMALWGEYSFTQSSLFAFDRIVAGFAALIPLLAFAAAMIVRRGRLLGVVGIASMAMALVAALVDPTSQDRHTILFRVAALAIGLMTVTEILQPGTDSAEGMRRRLTNTRHLVSSRRRPSVSPPEGSEVGHEPGVEAPQPLPNST